LLLSLRANPKGARRHHALGPLALDRAGSQQVRLVGGRRRSRMMVQRMVVMVQREMVRMMVGA